MERGKPIEIDLSIHIERENASTAFMAVQMSANPFPKSCTVLENKNIFDLPPNFLAFTSPILGW